MSFDELCKALDSLNLQPQSTEQREELHVEYNVRFNSLLNELRQNVNTLIASERGYVCSEEGIRFFAKCFNYSNQSPNEGVRLLLNIEVFRCLRNACATSTENQHKALVFVSSTVDVILNMLKENVCDGLVAERDKCLQCAMQFMGNLVVNNSQNKNIVWNTFKRHFHSFLTIPKNALISNCACMLLYNCLKDEIAIIQELLSENDLVSGICIPLLHNVDAIDMEWRFFTLNLLCRTSNCVAILYNHLSNEARLFLLHMVLDMIKAKEILNHQNVEFIAHAYKIHCQEILTDTKEICKENVVIEFLLTLEVLCTASSEDSYRKPLQSDMDLLTSTTLLLKNVHILGKSGDQTFSPIIKLSAVAQGEAPEDNNVFGLKRDLVRLIGNMCWRCKRNQDHIREIEGIPLLLDCCNVDAKNPFMIQWVIFAIRNICETNLQNQEIILQMNSLGEMDFKLLEEIGIKIDNTAEPATPLVANTREVARHSNLTDINDLFN